MSSSPFRTFFLGLSVLLGLGNLTLLADVREIATVVTSEGTMEFELYRDSSQLAVANFKYLADSCFYDGTKIHRLIKNFMAQGGDPGTVSDESVSNLYGTHGPEYSISNDPVDQVKFPLRKHAAGVLSMANSGGSATTGSQFFIMFAGNRPDLYAVHAQLGFLISGTSVLTALNDPTRELVAPSTDVMARLSMNPLLEDVNIRPKTPIVINSIRIRSEVISGTLSTTFPVASNEGLLRDIQRNILGRWTVAVTSRGTLSGQLQCYDRTFAYTGRLVPVAGSTTESECVVHLDTKAASPIRVRIHLRRNGPTTGSLAVAVCKLTGTEVLLADRAENVSSRLMAARDLVGPVLEAKYTASFDPPYLGSTYSDTLKGCGYMTANYLAKSGLCTVMGRLPDGVSVVASFSPSAEGGRNVLPLFTQRLTAGVPNFKFRGSLQVVPGQVNFGSLKWYRAAQTVSIQGGTTSAAEFDGILGTVLSSWTPPAKGGILGPFAANAGGGVIWVGSLAAQNANANGFQLSTANTSTSFWLNPSNMSLRFNPLDGSFLGNYQDNSGVSIVRRTFQGVCLQSGSASLTRGFSFRLGESLPVTVVPYTTPK